ncbi:type I-E CRISPR-associated protein Cse2/CasB [Streptosporangium sp. NPDC049248]|uniref:type I-E CRISPR-associated protein Cse2/CasB n=1 Tax=Streptosporangium sp. NPDC049248 TaxID=3155651 RepID=UPI0034138FBC
MPDPLAMRRDAYVTYLYRLDNELRSRDPRRSAQARRSLARLRHSFVEGRQYQAYAIVFGHEPPHDSAEQQVWLLVGGLFALHPLPWKGGAGPRSLGASMGRLHKKLGSPAVERRFTQLLARDKQALPHHLRQTIRLLSAHEVPVHYGRLLDDLVTLLGKDHRGDRASSVRLRWAEEYYLPVSAPTTKNSGEPSTDLPETTQ